MHSLRSSLFWLVVAVWLVGSSVNAWSAGGDLTWSYDYPKASKQQVTAAAFDGSGNAVMVGFDGTIHSDWLIVKVTSGVDTPVWTATYDHGSDSVGEDEAHDVVIDGDGNVIVTGFVHNGSNWDIHVVKYDGDGDGSGGAIILWQYTYDGGYGGDDKGMAVDIDGSNNVYVGGYGHDSNGRNDYVLLKFAHTDAHPDIPGPNINPPLEIATWNGAADGVDEITAIDVNASGVAVTGKSQNGSGDFDPVTLLYDLDLVRIGQVQQISDTGNGQGNDVAFDDDNNVVVTGYTDNGSNRDLFLAKYDDVMSATPVWPIKTVDQGDDDEGNALEIDESDGDIYVTGYSYFDATLRDVYTARYNAADGAEKWHYNYNSHNGDSDVGIDIWVDDYNEVYVVGYDDAILDDMLVLKLHKDAIPGGDMVGTLLWDKQYDAASHDDRAVAVGPGAAGELLVAGWSDVWTGDVTDCDFTLLRYEQGTVNPPTDLQASTVSESEIALSWQDNSLDEDGFVVERKICGVGNYTVITTPALIYNTVTYNSTGLAADTRYCYRVKATNNDTGDSPYSNEASAQTTVVNTDPPSWINQFNGPENDADHPTSISVGTDNNPVVTGHTYSESTYYDYYTIKVNRANAATIWAEDYDDPTYESDFATGVSVDSQNRVIVTGYASLWGGGPANTNDVYTLWYPAGGGDPFNDHQYNGPSGADDRSAAVAVSTDGDDNSVVIGYGVNKKGTPDDYTDDDDDIYVLKYEASGSLKWANTFDGGDEDYPESADFGPSGDIYVVGSTGNGTDADWYIQRYVGATGALSWPVKTFDGPATNGDDEAFSTVVDANGDFYVTGYVTAADNTKDIYTVKYNGADGSIAWEKSYSGAGDDDDQAFAVMLDPIDGSVLVAGSVTVSPLNQDYVLLRYSPTGTLIWDKVYDNPAGNDLLSAAGVDGNGSVTLVGTTIVSGQEDILTVKMDHLGIVLGVTHYDANGGDDGAVDVAVNSYGEAFVAAYVTNALDNSDYAVIKADGVSILPPVPFTGTAMLNDAVVTWGNTSPVPVEFDLDRATGTCDSHDVESDVGWDNLYSGTNQSYTDTTLTTNTTYCYRVKAFTDTGSSSRWLTWEGTTGTPQDPINVSATASSTTSVSLSWTDRTVGETGYLIQRCTGATCDFTSGQDGFEETEWYSGSPYSDTDLCPETLYRYQIKAWREGKWDTNWVEASSDPTTPAIVTPTITSVTVVSEVELKVTWTNSTSDETGFNIKSCEDGGSCTTHTVGQNQTTFNDTGLTPGTLYTYEVQPTKAGATCVWPTTPWSAPESGTPIIAPPANFTATKNGTTQIDLDWQDATASETGYRLERCAGASSTCCPGGVCVGTSFTTGWNLSSTDLDFQDDTVCENALYTYRLKSAGLGWSSAWVFDDAQTDAGSVPALSGSVQSESIIELNWDNSTLDGGATVELQRCDGNATACSSGPFSPLWTSPADQLADYNFDEGGWSYGATVVDSSGNGNDGNAYNLSAVTSRDATNAAYFQGSNDYVMTPLNIPQTSGSPGLTFMAWVRPTLNNSSNYLFSTESSFNGYDWGLALNGTTWYAATGSSYTSFGVTATINDWQHVAVTFKPGTGVLLYINGVYRNTIPTIGYDATTHNLVIGRMGYNTGSSFHFPGYVDDVKIYQEALTADQIEVLYDEKYIDDDLPPNTTYSYRLAANKDTNCDWGPLYSAPLDTFTTDAVFPPSGFSATQTSTTSIRLDWNDDYTSETAFDILRCEGCTDNSGTFTLYKTVGAGVETHTDTTVKEGTSYWYRIQARKGPIATPEWESGWSNDGAATPAAATPTLTLTSPGDNYIKLDWSVSGTDRTGFRIRRCQESVDGADCTPTTVLTSPGSTVRTYTDSSVVTWETYRYTIEAYKSATIPWTKVSAPVQEDTLSIGTPVLTKTSDNTNRITLGWTNPSQASPHFHLERCDDITDNACTNESLYAEIEETVANVTAYGDLTVCPGDQHIYRVKADKVGWSKPTDWGYSAVFTVDPVTKPLPFTGSSTLETEIDLNWTDTNVNGDRFELYQCEGLQADCIASGPWTTVSTTLTGTSRTVTGLNPATIYTYKITEVDDTAGGSCPWETDPNYVQVTTVVPPPVNAFTATAYSNSSTKIKLQFTDTTSSEDGFTVERCDADYATCCPSGTCDEGLFDEISISPLPAGSGVITRDDLTPCPGSDYTYRVQPTKSTWGVLPAWRYSSTSIPAVNVPINNEAALISESEVSVSWESSNFDATNYLLDRCTGDQTACNDTLGTWTNLAITDGDSSIDPDVYYHMNETGWSGTPGEVVDSTTGAQHAQAFNGVTTTTSGKYSYGGQFDGADDYILTPIDLDQAVTSTGHTIEAWVYPTMEDAGQRRYVFGTHAGGSNYPYAIYLYPYLYNDGYDVVEQFYWCIGTGRYERRISAAPYRLNDWQHVAVVYDPASNVLRFYLDGVMKYSTDTFEYLPASAIDNGLVIGARGPGALDSFFGGRIDEFVIYDRPLSDAEILADYQSAAGVYGHLDSGLDSGATYTYKMRAHKDIPSPQCAWFSDPVYNTVTTPAPNAPSDLQATRILSAEITLIWNDNSSTETGFRVQRCVGDMDACCPSGADNCNDGSFTSPGDLVGADIELYTDSDPSLCGGIDYTYRVRGEKDGSSLTDWSTAFTATTLNASSLPTPSVSVVDEVTTSTQWNDRYLDENRYLLQRCDGSCDAGGTYNTVVVSTPSDGGVVAHYRMDDSVWAGRNDEVFDATLQFNHGRTVGSVTLTAQGKYNSAALFSGSNGYIETGLSFDQTSGGPGATFEAWMHPADTPTYTDKYLFSTDNGDEDWGLLQYYSNWYVDNGDAQVDTGVAIVDDWQHVAVVFDPSSGVKLYVDGVEEWSDATIGFDASSGDLVIGRMGTSADDYFAGRVDEVMVYARPLSAAEIQSHYQAQVNKQYNILDATLDQNATYTYRLVAQSDEGCTWERTSGTVVVSTSDPLPPTGLVVDAVNTNTTTLNWDERTGSETNIELERCLGSGCDFSTIELFNLDPNTETYNDNLSCNGSLYRYRVRAVRSSGGSGWPTAYDGPVDATKPQLIAPDSLSAVQVGGTRVDLTWNDITPDEVGFIIQRKCLLAEGCDDFIKVDEVGAGAESYQDSTVESGHAYTYRVVAFKDQDCTNEGGVSSEATVLVEPATIIDLTLTKEGSRKIKLNWTDPIAEEDVWEIETQLINNRWVLIGTTGRDANMFIDTISIDPETVHTYRVRAVKAGLYSSYSDIEWIKSGAWDDSHDTCTD